jgi:putative heme iron utilization protein
MTARKQKQSRSITAKEWALVQAHRNNARARLLRFLKRYPEATCAAAARAIGVTRQRVHQILRDEGVELNKFSITYPVSDEYMGPGPNRRRRGRTQAR